MRFCTSCGERCKDDAALTAHVARHRSKEQLPGASVSEAFRRAFERNPTDKELQEWGGDVDKLFALASPS